MDNEQTIKHNSNKAQLTGDFILNYKHLPSKKVILEVTTSCMRNCMYTNQEYASIYKNNKLTEKTKTSENM